MGWSTAGIVTNPSLGAVLADTGPVGPGVVLLTVLLWSNKDCVLTVSYRDGANTVDLGTQQLQIGADAISTKSITSVQVRVEKNERFRVVMGEANFNGKVQASLIWS